MTDTLQQTPLHQWHESHGGRMVDFAGWSMPVQYEGIVAEHQATRNAVTAFDVSHMGRLHIEGPGAGEFLDSLTTRRVADMKVGEIRYSLITNPEGGVLDDVLVYRLETEGFPPYFGMVVNASNREKIVAWIEQQLTDEHNAAFEDQTHDTAMIAIQGPRAMELVAPLVGCDLANMPYYHGEVTTIGDIDALVSRTGYTGEDGCEIVTPADEVAPLWEKLFELGEQYGIAAAGLGARDTLRLEAGMPLYGHELSETINPLQAGLKFAVNTNDREFIGRDAIAAYRENPTGRVRIALELQGRRAAREGYSILADGEQIGEVTSGAFSPTLQRPIAMGYVDPQFRQTGGKLEVDIRGAKAEATVVKLPFYKR